MASTLKDPVYPSLYLISLKVVQKGFRKSEYSVSLEDSAAIRPRIFALLQS